MLITFTYKFIIIMLICYVTIKLSWQTCLLISSIVAYTALQRTHLLTTSLGPIVRAVSLIPRGYISAVNRLKKCNRVNHSHGLWLIMINRKFKILGFTCKCVEIKKCMTNSWQTSLRKHNLLHFRQVWDIILIILLLLFFCFIQPLSAVIMAIIRYQATSLQSQYTFIQLLSKYF